MAFPRIGGSGVGLTVNAGLVPFTAGQTASTVATQTAGLTNAITLAPGESFVIPSGTWNIQPGPCTFLQFEDPVTNIWKNMPTYGINLHAIDSDGSNWRLANLTGCAIGALITNAGGANATNGIGSTATGLTVTVSSGASTWQPVVGGVVSLTVTTNTATQGASYTFPPIVIIDAPPVGGVQATAHCSLSAGKVLGANVTVDNQGAGYVSAPTMTLVNDPRDTTGSGAAVTCTLTGTGQLSALYPLTNGTAISVVPTFTFSTGTAAATCIMNFTVTGYVSNVPGTGYSAGTEIWTGNNVVAGTPVFTNPLMDRGLTTPRPGRILATLSGTGIATGGIVEDPGLGIQALPLPNIVGQAASVTLATVTLSVGGTTDTSYIQPV